MRFNQLHLKTRFNRFNQKTPFKLSHAINCREKNTLNFVVKIVHRDLIDCIDEHKKSSLIALLVVKLCNYILISSCYKHQIFKFPQTKTETKWRTKLNANAQIERLVGMNILFIYSLMHMCFITKKKGRGGEGGIPRYLRWNAIILILGFQFVHLPMGPTSVFHAHLCEYFF